MNEEQKVKLQAILLDLAAQIAEVDAGLPKGWFAEISQSIRDL